MDQRAKQLAALIGESEVSPGRWGQAGDSRPGLTWILGALRVGWGGLTSGRSPLRPSAPALAHPTPS